MKSPWPVIDWCRTVIIARPSNSCQARIKPTTDDQCQQKTLFFFSKDVGVKAVLTGKRQTRTPQNQLGQCRWGIKATVVSGQIFFSRAWPWPSWPSWNSCPANMFIFEPFIKTAETLLKCGKLVWHRLLLLVWLTAVYWLLMVADHSLYQAT